MTLFSFLGYSQETISGIAINNNNVENEAVILSFVCKNDVSATMTAHTYKLNDGSEMNVQYIDGAQQTTNKASVNHIINKFLAVPGVSDCTFDKATQTFTILSEPSAILSSMVQSINKN
jgi:hypothetical protein